MWDNGKQPIVLPPANLSQNSRLSNAGHTNSSAHLCLPLASLPETPNYVIKSICIHFKQRKKLLIRYIPSFCLFHIKSFFWFHLCQFCWHALLVWQWRALLPNYGKKWRVMDSLLCALPCMSMLGNSYTCNQYQEVTPYLQWVGFISHMLRQEAVSLPH